jgi:hypothetical protein
LLSCPSWFGFAFVSGGGCFAFVSGGGSPAVRGFPAVFSGFDGGYGCCCFGVKGVDGGFAWF